MDKRAQEVNDEATTEFDIRSVRWGGGFTCDSYTMASGVAIVGVLMFSLLTYCYSKVVQGGKKSRASDYYTKVKESLGVRIMALWYMCTGAFFQ